MRCIMSTGNVGQSDKFEARNRQHRFRARRANCSNISSNPKSGWDRGFSVPGAFKLDHLQPFELILSQKIFIFFTFILGGQFLLPQRANMQEREFSQLQNWIRHRGLGAWGIQTGPFAAHWAHFVPKDFQLFHLHTGRPILITPEG